MISLIVKMWLFMEHNKEIIKSYYITDMMIDDDSLW